MRKLHQFAMSHYCDKVRWALDLKGLDYEVHNYAPGEHIVALRRLTRGHSTLPVLVDGDHIVRNSHDIITYLDAAYPAQPLTPTDVTLRDAALHWEAFADEHLGPHVRRVIYAALFRDSDLALQRITLGLPSTKKKLVAIGFPILRASMKRAMQIYPGPVARSEQALIEHIGTLNAHMKTRDLLVGDRLTRADLAVASLLRPLLIDAQGNQPSSLISPALAELAVSLDWVMTMYDTHRSSQ